MYLFRSMKQSVVNGKFVLLLRTVLVQRGDTLEQLILSYLLEALSFLLLLALYALHIIMLKKNWNFFFFSR